jgi:hypothetical protein
MREFESIGLRRSPAIVHRMHRCEAAEKSHQNGSRNAVLYRTGTKTFECLKTSAVRSEIIKLPEIDVIKTVDRVWCAVLGHRISVLFLSRDLKWGITFPPPRVSGTTTALSPQPTPPSRALST